MSLGTQCNLCYLPPAILPAIPREDKSSPEMDKDDFVDPAEFDTLTVLFNTERPGELLPYVQERHVQQVGQGLF